MMLAATASSSNDKQFYSNTDITRITLKQAIILLRKKYYDENKGTIAATLSIDMLQTYAGKFCGI